MEATQRNSGLRWHILTCEYPPQTGGVSDYTFLVAKGLASQQDEVHIWRTAWPRSAPELAGVTVHSAGHFTPSDLRAIGRELDRFPRPRRLLVQWVPHGFGYKSMNLPFCLWLWHRSTQRADQVELMVHEPFLPFLWGNWRQNAAATIHRVMTAILLRTAHRVWVSTPAWEKALRHYDLGRRHDYHWLPVPSNVPRVDDPDAVAGIRRRYGRRLLVGHFGTFSPSITPMLDAIIPPVLRNTKDVSVVLIGSGSDAFRKVLTEKHPELEDSVYATGRIEDPNQLSAHLSACDLLIQPYPDGVTTRRTTIMAALLHGLAAVTTAGALTEPFWKSSGAVVLSPASDTQAFIDSTLRLLASSEDRAALAKTGREVYRRHFDVEHILALLRGSMAEKTR